MLLYVGRDGDVEPQTVSITVVHLGEVVVTSLWDVTPCGMVDRIGSQYYGTSCAGSSLTAWSLRGVGFIVQADVES
jgi:hypothetical protein